MKTFTALKLERVVRTALIILLILSSLWCLLFFFSQVGSEMSKLIRANPVTDKLCSIYWSCLPSAISIWIALVNMGYAITDLYKAAKVKNLNQKRLAQHIIYTAVSLSAIIINCIAFYYVFGALCAG